MNERDTLRAMMAAAIYGQLRAETVEGMGSYKGDTKLAVNIADDLIAEVERTSKPEGK